jgi:hypothetical protein
VIFEVDVTNLPETMISQFLESSFMKPKIYLLAPVLSLPVVSVCPLS